MTLVGTRREECRRSDAMCQARVKREVRALFCAIFRWLLAARRSILTAMNMILSTHNVTLTKAIEDHIISRITKLEHLNRFATNTRVTLERDQTKAPERQFACSMRVSLPGPDLFAADVEADLYAAI